MFEELTVQATQTVLALFWITFAFILIAAVAATRADKRTKA